MSCKKSKCSVNGCIGPHKRIKKGMCQNHYYLFKKYGFIPDRNRFTPNEIVIFKDKAEIILYNINFKEIARAKIDIEDIGRCRKFKWCLANSGYVSTHNRNKTLFLHNYLLGFLNVDHVNRNSLDNQKHNLRRATHSENMSNVGVRKDNNTGLKGVSYNKQLDKYCARICKDKIPINLGWFESKIEAALHYNNAAKKYHGEFAYLNDINKLSV